MSYPGDVNLKLTNVPTSPCYAILMMPMNIPCTVNCLTCFVSAQANQLQHAVPVQQRYKTTSLPRSKRLLVSWLQLPFAVILEPKKINVTVSQSIWHEVMELGTMIFVF